MDTSKYNGFPIQGGAGHNKLEPGVRWTLLQGGAFLVNMFKKELYDYN